MGHLPDDHLPNLTIPARDWIKKFVAGEKTPYADSINPDDYEVIELIASVLIDPMSGGSDSGLLPKSAVDYVQEWLYRMEESTNLHIWDVADIARPFLAHAFALAQSSDSTEGGKEALQAALSQLCTRDELTRFYERHNLKLTVESTYKPNQQARDRQVAIKAARVLADPFVSEDVKNPIRDAILDLSTASDVYLYSPALAERALTLMFESKKTKLPHESQPQAPTQTCQRRA